MTRTSEDIAHAPLDLVIERIRRVYRGWNRDTSVAQMRLDFHGGGFRLGSVSSHRELIARYCRHRAIASIAEFLKRHLQINADRRRP
jgi:acetyl esterase/lipase